MTGNEFLTYWALPGLVFIIACAVVAYVEYKDRQHYRNRYDQKGQRDV